MRGPTIIRNEDELKCILNTYWSRINNHYSNHKNMTYEEGAIDMYNWIVGNSDSNDISKDIEIVTCKIKSNKKDDSDT